MATSPRTRRPAPIPAEAASPVIDTAAAPAAAAPATAAALRASVDPLVQRFIDRARNDVVRLRQSIEHARRGDPAALEQVERIAHSIHGTGALFGLSRVSAAGEAVARLAAEITANIDGHSPLDDSALVRQIPECIERLARAVETASQTAPDAGGMFQPRRAGP